MISLCCPGQPEQREGSRFPRPSGQAGESPCACRYARRTLQNDKAKTFVKRLKRAPYATGARFRLRMSKNPRGGVGGGRSPFDFYSYPPALPAGRVIDFACKINSLQLRTTSGWPKLLPRKSGGSHFFDTLRLPGGVVPPGSRNNLKNASVTDKPSSVVDDHLSRPDVTARAQAVVKGATGRRICLYTDLAPGGVYIADKSPSRG